MDRIMISKIGIAAVLALAGGLIHSSLPAAINFQEPNKAPTGGEQDKPGWKSLFDGKTLDGWKAADFNHRGKVFVKDDAWWAENLEKTTIRFKQWQIAS